MRARIGSKKALVRGALRLPQPLRDQLAQIAHTSGRSINYEILLRLRESVGIDHIFKASDAEKLGKLKKLERRRLKFPSAREAE